MIVTKEHQEKLVDKYIKEKHNQDECIGFIDGLNTALKLVEKLNMQNVMPSTFPDPQQWFMGKYVVGFERMHTIEHSGNNVVRFIHEYLDELD